MAALRHAASRMLAGQAPQPIYRAAVGEQQQRRLLPTVIPSSSSAYPRRFSSMQHGEDDPLTVEEKIRIYKRGAHVIYRTTKAVGTIVGCCFAIKISLTLMFTPVPELLSSVEESKKKAQDMLRELWDNILRFQFTFSQFSLVFTRWMFLLNCSTTLYFICMVMVQQLRKQLASLLVLWDGKVLDMMVEDEELLAHASTATAPTIVHDKVDTANHA